MSSTGTSEGQGRSIQERLYPSLTCFGCGHANPKGLKLRSFLEDGVVTARFTPWPEHDNGMGYLNGGIISTVLDCHGGAAVIAEAHRREWLTDGLPLSYVTARLDVRFLRPTPLEEALLLRATLLESSEEAMTVEATVSWEGKQRAAATALWKRWRPR
jgi:acyl-coenzyme A thioesterase PaaI-like protein